MTSHISYAREIPMSDSMSVFWLSIKKLQITEENGGNFVMNFTGDALFVLFVTADRSTYRHICLWPRHSMHSLGHITLPSCSFPVMAEDLSATCSWG
jgi:hypothetical protein